MQTATKESIRNWCLGTLLGVIMISIISNLISDSIPNPINYVIRWISGKEAEEAEQHDFRLLTLDGKTAAKSIIYAEKYEPDGQNWVNCYKFRLEIQNHGPSIKKTVFASYYLPPELALDPTNGVPTNTFPPYTRNTTWPLIGEDFVSVLASGYSSEVDFIVGFGEVGDLPDKPFKIGLSIHDEDQILYKGEITMQLVD